MEASQHTGPERENMKHLTGTEVERFVLNLDCILNYTGSLSLVNNM